MCYKIFSTETYNRTDNAIFCRFMHSNNTCVVCTTAGSGIGGFDAFYAFAESLSPLGNATAEDCANYVVSLFSDLTRMVTMQNLYHDGGFSYTGISDDLMARMKPEA
jgi:enoyl-[acyl-carrier-protein] reductase (NADH)